MPVPPNGSETVKVDADLMFRPAYQAVSHRVYFGQDGKLKAVATLQDGNIVNPGELNAGEIYLWRVDGILKDGTVVEGELWSFTVVDDGNRPQ